MQACTGPGKTFALAVLVWNFLLTRPNCAIGVTSVNAANLRTNVWTELARLYEKSPFLKKKFAFTGSTIFARESPLTWKCEARTWAKDANAEQIGAALRGLHAKFVMWAFDEAGAAAAALLPILEAIFSGEPEEAHIVMAGNPISRQGLLFRACITNRRFWRVVEITADPDDPNRTPRVSVAHARQQIAGAALGREDPWVRMNILGLFPLSDVNALIGEDEVRASMSRIYREDQFGDAPKILGVDVARQGDDSSVIFPRQGLQCFTPTRKRGLTSTQGAGLVARQWQDWGADGCFIDMTGGFGAGWYDKLVELHFTPIGVEFASAAHKPQRYYNKRAEMYFDAVEWIRRGGALCESAEIVSVLSQITYTFAGDRLLLEDKDSLKARLGYSPDETDGFVTTFAEPVVRISRTAPRASPSAARAYNPFADIDGG